jgi:hypothetical protein
MQWACHDKQVITTTSVRARYSSALLIYSRGSGSVIGGRTGKEK